jgi:hypothetical protein
MTDTTLSFSSVLREANTVLHRSTALQWQMTWLGHVTYIQETRNSYQNLYGKPHGKT